MTPIDLVVSCTKRKTREPPAALRLRGVPVRGPVEDRAECWLERLRASRQPPLPAVDLCLACEQGRLGRLFREIRQTRLTAGVLAEGAVG